MLGLYYNHIAPKICLWLCQKSGGFSHNQHGQDSHPASSLPARSASDPAHHEATGLWRPYPETAQRILQPLVSNVVEAIHQVPELLPPLRRSIRTSSWSGNIPAFVHLDFDKLCGGKYDWNHVKQLLIEECGWVPPADDKVASHQLPDRKCKDYSQFIRFTIAKSKMIPFSSFEISPASRNCGVSREEMLYEMERQLDVHWRSPWSCHA